MWRRSTMAWPGRQIGGARRRARWASALGVGCFVAVATGATSPRGDNPWPRGDNPLPAPIRKAELAVAAVPFARLPRSVDPPLAQGTPPAWANAAYARIQSLTPVPDGSGRLAVNDLRGPLHMVPREGGASTLYLDHRTAAVGFQPDANPNESGFLGLAFHPEFAVAGKPGHGKFYTAYSASVPSGEADYLEASSNVQESVVREWTAADPAAPSFSGTSREVLRVGQPDALHNVGTLAFNPTAGPGSADRGLLYISFGDGGPAHDPHDRGQRRETPLGAILRIDPLPPSPRGRAYGIPADNPFVGLSGVAAEIWAYGLRHPQQFSWDVDGRMFIADIGQASVEEVNLGVAGGNYGWRLREGTFATEHAVGELRGGPVYPRPATDPTSLIYPVAQYDHDEGRAIGGGFVYRGDGVPALTGKYVFTDLVLGRLFAIDADNLAAEGGTPIVEVRIVIDGEEVELRAVAGFTDFYGAVRVGARLGVDHAGELYLLTKGDGWIRKLTAAPGGPDDAPAQ